MGLRDGRKSGLCFLAAGFCEVPFHDVERASGSNSSSCLLSKPGANPRPAIRQIHSALSVSGVEAKNVQRLIINRLMVKFLPSGYFIITQMSRKQVGNRHKSLIVLSVVIAAIRGNVWQSLCSILKTSSSWKSK
jgi:hypothetical protein